MEMDKTESLAVKFDGKKLIVLWEFQFQIFIQGKELRDLLMELQRNHPLIC